MRLYAPVCAYMRLYAPVYALRGVTDATVFSAVLCGDSLLLTKLNMLFCASLSLQSKIKYVAGWVVSCSVYDLSWPSPLFLS